eukprot:CAMPEP_0170526888 /NCGR_PEP_ID=MMETSP0209-20121228/12303_1 /TAXON_ID=665100 ORGANISM="Litonotus pictus, Strain P1" /NCGR_SAMPLE_ID=MMETSP0209 /ASSEMBLY_ACC=CAM_ASM_000301 /LENGTH=33 /DNA_ID= /DNA_START= /DNA_END= /DNA_ORIENTATION=
MKKLNTLSMSLFNNQLDNSVRDSEEEDDKFEDA